MHETDSLFPPPLLLTTPKPHPSRLRKEYELIADKALTTPSNTDQLMELTEYMEGVQKKDILELEERMVEAQHRIHFLVLIGGIISLDPHTQWRI